MNKTLTIVITQHWFDKIASGEKKEDFREIKKYWNQRLVYPQFVTLSKNNLYFPPNIRAGKPNTYSYKHPYQNFGMAVKIDFKEYDTVKVVVGYKEGRDELVAKFNGIRITAPNEQTDLGVGCYYAINIGEIIRKNVSKQERE
jgi:hypothetical protein